MAEFINSVVISGMRTREEWLRQNYAEVTFEKKSSDNKQILLWQMGRTTAICSPSLHLPFLFPSSAHSILTQRSWRLLFRINSVNGNTKNRSISRPCMCIKFKWLNINVGKRINTFIVYVTIEAHQWMQTACNQLDRVDDLFRQKYETNAWNCFTVPLNLVFIFASDIKWYMIITLFGLFFFIEVEETKKCPNSCQAPAYLLC